jgi:hypothetical protein
MVYALHIMMGVGCGSGYCERSANHQGFRD